MPNDNRNKELLTDSLREVWSGGNIEAANKYIASRYTIHHDPGDPWEERELDLEGFKERVRLSRAPFPDQCFEIRGIFADGDAVFVTWFSRGTHKGDLPGFPASGRQIKMSGATVYYFEGDRITGHWQVADRLGVFQQLRQQSVVAK
jgi:predicted ester cyclase